MAKPKATKAGDQKSITSFFGRSGGNATKEKKPAAKPKKVVQVVDDEDEPEDDVDAADGGSDYVQDSSGEEADEPVEDEDASASEVNASDAEMEDEEEEKPAKKARALPKVKASAIDTSELPPIHDISSIFLDLVSRANGLKDVIKQKLQGRKLRVATMCSGTESPLLALEETRRAIKSLWELDLQVEHVFSCEIEPFKQAYIERNFSPPLLFRDVCELGSAHAHTAYGSLAPVPGDVDLLVAGTSCVDYSNLNNEKQDIDGHGESGRTFRGMLDWVDKHRPPLVVLENVCSAPWPKVVEYFRQKGYAAQFARVDTKNYYIPHTRTRVYLLAVNMKNSDIPEKWLRMVTEMRRPASSTLDAFLLPSDDPRIHQAREKLVRESFNGLDRRTGRMDWGRCESRHQRARLEEELGSSRPLTHWNNSGFCKLPDFAWNDWGIGQVERVWDLMDISLLRSAKEGVDPSYKTLVWNLSQNVDRTIGSSKPGICPCLTPSMIPYLTNRGGPMVGLEALSMQGLPVDELLLTRETEDQLADLAGNAMSTTVVGTCIIAALIVGKKLLKESNDTTTYEQHRSAAAIQEEDDVDDVLMNIDKLDIGQGQSLEEHISGGDKLKEKPLDLAARASRSLSDLLVDAARSARLCECEGRKDVTTRPLKQCQNCGSTTCVKCGGYPEHKFEDLKFDDENPRLHPSEFERELKASLPMAVLLSNITQESLDSYRAASGADIPSTIWKKWSAAVVRAASSEFHFAESKRQEIWSVVYQSSSGFGTLELLLHPQQPEWRFFAKPDDEEPVQSEVRIRLESAPAGRLVCREAGELLEGSWEFGLPSKESFKISVEGDKLVPSWEADLGLTGEEFENKKVHSQLAVVVDEADKDKLERDISGTYILHEKCGMANASLHKKVPTREEKEKDLPPVFLFLDPTRTGKGEDDSFVFSITRKRCEYGETRPVICTVDARWRQSDVEGVKKVECWTPCKWVNASEVTITPAENRNAVFAVPSDVLKLDLSSESCRSATALLTCRVPLPGEAGNEWPVGAWREVDKVHERGTFKALAWLTERVRSDNHFADWQEAHVHGSQDDCERCAPRPPEIKWARNDKRRIVAVEDTAQAGAYERALKRRPAPFVTQLKLDESGVGHVRIGINIASLMHRAMSRLPKEGRTEPATVAWRLNSNFSPMATLQLQKFQILSNRHDDSHSQPPSFKIPLRPEQLRSLTWMLRQEAADAPPFMEEEISEAILHPLGWRVEGRAQRPNRVRGGVLADEVGYGKTAITLGLIDCAAKDVQKEFSRADEIPGKIAVKGTLVIVPPHLTGQWESECKKFAGKRFKVVNLTTASNLNSTSVEDITEADIIIVASNLFRSGVYLENLADFAAAGGLPEKQDGRYFDARLEVTLKGLEKQVDLLRKSRGPEQVLAKIRAALKKGQEEDQLIVQTKRLKGKSYRDKAMAQETEVKKPQPQSARSPQAAVRNGLKMEVVVPPARSKFAGTPPPSSPSVKAETTADDDSDVPVQPRRAAVKRKVITLSDDDDDEPAPSVKNPTKNGKSKKAASSDYEASSDEDDVMEVDSDEDSKPKKKLPAKGKGKISKKGKASASSGVSSESEATDGMDIDEPVGAKGKGKGGKTAKKRRSSDSSDIDDEDTKRPAKKAKKPRRGEADPWKLGSSAVKKDYEQMKAPPLEIFHFARKVVDEYTYLEGRTLSMITKLTAERHWVLSGTPPTADFGSLKTISAFLNIHLGVNDDGEGESAKKRKREQTDVEKFHSFREVHSLEWHAHRHELGQAFLNQFVRQNIAEIDEIPCTHMIEKIVLPAAERAIYLELDHHLKALDMTVKRGKKTESDREKRMALVLGESASAEEALLKRCAHFDLEAKKDNAMKACEIIVAEREAQMDDCKAEYIRLVKKAVIQEKEIGKIAIDESLFQEHARVLRANQTTDGDAESTKLLVKLLDDAKVPVLNAPPKAKGAPPALTEKQKAKIWEHRELTHEIRRVAKELVGRMRSLRYFRAVRDLQKPEEERPSVSCPRCGKEGLPLEDISISSTCGHMGCNDCVKEAATGEHCIYTTCRCNVKLLNIIKASSLGVDDVRDGKRKHYGKKLEEVINLIKKRIPADERVLIFVQFPDLMKKVGEALDTNKIKFLEIKGSASVKSNNLLRYQNDPSERVLLLNVMDESASGANLTGANHAIFLSPLLAQTQEQYVSCETQAIGRVRRYGQNKHVRIWRFLSLDTIDTEIIEQRTGRDVDGNPVQV